MRKTFKILLFAIILLVGVGALGIYWTFYRPLPDYNSTVKIKQLHQPVNIYWDSGGVPHIYARNKHDLYMALGYAHAQDRLWQMTISQLAAQGRFAEFFGNKLIPLDKQQRTIGFWRIAQKMQKQLPDSMRRVLQAYADGVNQYVKMHPKELPVQFSMAGMKPIKWSVTYSLAIARLMAWKMNTAWSAELTYALLRNKLSPKQYKALFPDAHIPAPQPKLAKSDTTLAAVVQPLLNHYHIYQQLMGTEGKNVGSNAWAVDGRHSATGYPMLAGDPHLGLHIPGKWYEVHLNLNGFNLSGATLPGAPVVVLGQNDVLGWSLTNVMLDDTDFFEEKTDPQDSTRYLADSLNGKPVYKKYQIQRSLIKVKDGKDRVFTRKLTRHGPVISDIYPEQNEVNGKVITMKWTGQQPSHEIAALQGMGWAHSFSRFKKAIQLFKVPALNVVYADTAGNIGLFTMAHVPVRSGNPIALRPGWKPQSDWQGYIPFKKLPKVVNPQKGWVANANNPVADSSYAHYISIYWQPPSRYDRIKHYLNEDDKFNVQAFQEMQQDDYSGYAGKVTHIILPILKSAPDSSFTVAIDYLENWNYNYNPSETAASILDEFLLRLSANVFKDEMGPDTYKSFIRYSAKPAQALLRFLQNGSSFFDDVHTPKKETKDQMIRKSMRQAIIILRSQYGDKPVNWRWGNIHTLTLKPSLFGKAAESPNAPRVLKMIVNNLFAKGPYPVPGNSMTINNGEYRWNDPFKMILGPSIRRIIDLSNTHKSYSIMPGGQSENPFSDYYNDQTQGWLKGRYKTLAQDSTLFQQYAIMKLVPN
jgi:penicillin amidase